MLALLLSFSFVLSPVNSSPDWWTNGIFYRVEVESFRDYDGNCIGDLKGIFENVDYFNELGVTGVILNNFFSETNLTDVNPEVGSLDDVIKLIYTFHSQGLYVLVEYAPGYTSHKHPWFSKSAEHVSPYGDYYRWSQRSYNWLNTSGESAFVIDPSSKSFQFYLQFFGEDYPQLNFHNFKVNNDIRDVFMFWANLGVDGFYLKHVSYLYQVVPYQNELKLPQCYDSRYECYNHSLTSNLFQSYILVREWSKQLENLRKISKIVLIAEPYTQFSIEEGTKYLSNGASMVISNVLLNWTETTSESDLIEKVQAWVNGDKDHRIGWMLGSKDVSRAASRLGRYQADGASMVAYLLPGPYIIYYGEELGMSNDENGSPTNPLQWNTQPLAGFSSGLNCTYDALNPDYWEINVNQETRSSLSHYAIHKRLIQLRKEIPSESHLQIYRITNNTICFTRRVEDDLYMVLINTGSAPQMYNMHNVDSDIPGKMFVHTPTLNAGYKIWDQIDTTSINLKPNAGLVLTTKDKPKPDPNSAPLLRSSSVIFIISISWIVKKL